MRRCGRARAAIQIRRFIMVRQPILRGVMVTTPEVDRTERDRAVRLAKQALRAEIERAKIEMEYAPPYKPAPEPERDAP